MDLITSILSIFANPWTIISLVFWGIVLLAAYVLRKRKDAAYIFFPLLAMFKTKRLNNFIRNISRKAPRFWRAFWTIGIFVSFCFTIIAFWYFFSNLISLIIAPQIQNAIVPIIPGVTISLPVFAYLLLPLLFIMTTHEFAHGISASIDDVEVVSTGVLGVGVFFLIGFGAFVEVDERKLRSSRYKRNTRLRISAAGTYVNAITAGIAFIILLAFPYINAPYYRYSVQIAQMQTQAQGGFNYGNLTAGDVLVGIKEGSGDYIYLDYGAYVYINYNSGITLNDVLTNKSGISCAIGDVLTIYTYNPNSDIEQEKNVTLGPKYNIGIEFEKHNDSAIIITNILSLEEGGNNYDKGLTESLVITKVNGTAINYTSGNTLEKFLTNYNLDELNLTAVDSSVYSLDVEVSGVFIGLQYGSFYWMHVSSIGKLFGPGWADFIYREFLWLFTIAFSIVLFNMLPLPIFDGDRVLKELINWGIGEGSYRSKKKKKDKLYFEKGAEKYGLSEYRVEKIDSVKIVISEDRMRGEREEITLSEDNYELIDDIGDEFKDTILLKLPEQSSIKKNSIVEVTYEHYYDEKMTLKKFILNTIRVVTVTLVALNFIISIAKFGSYFFWL